MASHRKVVMVKHQLNHNLNTRHKVVLIGHSFVKRHKNEVMRGVPGHHAGSDIIDNQHSLPSILADRMKISNHYHSVYTHCKDIYFVEQLLGSVDDIKALNPDVVLANIGTNRMANLEDPTEAEIEHLASWLRFLASRFPAHIPVIFMGMVPRLEGIIMSAEQFRASARIFNSKLEKYEQDSMQGIGPVNFRYHPMTNWDFSDTLPSTRNSS